MSLTLDGSATLAWIYSEESTEPIRRLFEAVADEGALRAAATALGLRLLGGD